jgi:endonuclease YncB( thermonuclease family)
MSCGVPSILFAPQPAFEARVIGIIDGDTIHVLHNGKAQRIRLYGIDAPERRQAFGTKAQDYLGNLIFKQTVKVVVRTRDRYQRAVADIYLNNKSINHEMVKAGLAWWYRRYAPKETGLRDLEEQAREQGLGLWADPNATAPWNYRKPTVASFSRERR